MPALLQLKKQETVNIETMNIAIFLSLSKVFIFVRLWQRYKHFFIANKRFRQKQVIFFILFLLWVGSTTKDHYKKKRKKRISMLIFFFHKKAKNTVQDVE